LCSNVLSYSWQIKRASNNCIHQTGTCPLAIERRLGSLENHQETIYKTPPYPREKCCSEDRPTSMLLDVFPIITPTHQKPMARNYPHKEKGWRRKRARPATTLRREFLRWTGYVQSPIPNNDDHPATFISNTNSTSVRGFPEAPLFKGVTI
jgi:hypothetical protein